MDFKNVPNKYRPIPFWSWNDKLEVNETKKQIYEMNDVGIGGFFMHARGGLKTPYMGEEWYENVDVSIKTAEETKMYAWAYDENGWPSGFGDGKVNGLGVDYQQKYLRMEDENNHPDTYISKCGDHHFYYEINPFYVDTLDKKVIKEFIEVAYKPYYERFGNKIEGFFTDEPQVSRNGLPWSFVFEEEYKKRYNENILDHLEELFIMKGDYKDTRVKFWKMVTDLFSDAYMKQIHDACQKFGFKFTGHLTNETHFLQQAEAHGACMPHYEYFDIPGMDWLGRDVGTPLIVYQLSSAAEQLGQELVLTETFGLCGHNVSFAELKGVYEWQLVRGVNLMCQHLEGYSIKGIRKRDYPPAMYKQQPWWKEYKTFVDGMSREGMVLSKTEKKPDVLVMHPQTTVWSYYDADHFDDINALNDRFVNTLESLEEKHIQFHLGDETMIERHGKVENDKFVIGKQKYSYVVISDCEVLLENTKKLLAEFEKNGGKIVTVDELSTCNVVEDKKITYAKRENDEFIVHYFVNTSSERKDVRVNVKGKKLNIYTGELESFSGEHNFEPWGSLLIIDDGSEVSEKDEEISIVKLDGNFKLEKGLSNTLTLDHCDYYFDGELQEENAFVLNICERANALEREVKIHQDYRVNIVHKPEVLYLVCEIPEFFKIKVNGNEVCYKGEGTFVDSSFKKISIAEYVKTGENIISFDCNFKQSDEFYENLRKAHIFESEKNKIAYDVEIEAIYLLGEFSVKTEGEWELLDKDASRYKGEFVIDEPKTEISLKSIEKQGFPFFCGDMNIVGKINITGNNPVLELDVKGINAVRVEIGGKSDVMITDNRLSLKDFNVSGEAEIKLTLTNNLRNLLGPHHLEQGECYKVGPGNFFKEICLWKKAPVPNSFYNTEWNDDYCFVEMSI